MEKVVLEQLSDVHPYRNQVRRLTSTWGSSKSRACWRRQWNSVWGLLDMSMTPRPRNLCCGWALLTLALFRCGLSVMLQLRPLYTRRRRLESVFWRTSAQIRLWRPAENCECWTPSEWAAWGCRWHILSILAYMLSVSISSSDQLGSPSASDQLGSPSASEQTVLTFTFQIQTFDSPGADWQVSLLTKSLPLCATGHPTHMFASVPLRLVYRQLYPLAIKVCHYLKIPDYHGVSRVLRHWASCKVKGLPLPLPPHPHCKER